MSDQHKVRVLVAFLLFVALTSTVLADPCGMVPPVYLGQGVPLVRIGEQQTYVFYKDGMETFVIRPGFQGKVDEFGMLIPFPTPPAIRKVPDHIFQHLAAAVDPPEVVIDLRLRFAKRSMAKSRSADFKNGQKKLEYDAVRVVRQEAVGMYEVAVLEAGSPAALKRWMDEHGYRYPEGMDQACADYVDDQWCFVAVKTRVGQKKGVEPRPGQRQVNSKLPDGSAFDGFVQAMGFRFPVDELVVPMRLSAFNAGELRNIVYILTDGPRRIRSIPSEYVVRQLTGTQLLANFTQPLPLRIIGGTLKDVPEGWLKNYEPQRNPEPKNGAAKELFASDLLAAATDQLSLPHEEREKELLRISERLGLRGGQIDKLHALALAEQRNKTVADAAEQIRNMTLTVVDGDFPREVLADQNLRFAEYTMPRKLNSPQSYDAKLKGPAGKKEGVLKVGSTGALQQERRTMLAGSRHHGWHNGLALLVVGCVAVGLIGGRVKRGFRALLLAAVCAGAVTSAAWAAEPAAEKPTIRQLLNDLSHADKAAAACDALVARGEEAKPQLLGEALEGNDMARRGWAISCLSEIGGKDVDEALTKIHSDGQQPMLVRTWAAAARVAMTDSSEGLIKKANLVPQFPAIGRPVGMRLVEMLSQEDDVSPEALLSVSLQVPQLQQALGPAILALGSDKLTKVMTSAQDQNVRRQATAYLGTLAGQGDEGVARAVIGAYRFDVESLDVPWRGGPLFVPGMQWTKENARALAGNLIRWHLWCDRKGRKAEQTQIHNNIRSLGLAQAAGYQSPGFQEANTVKWLQVWAKAVGKAEVEQILKEQGVADVKKYAAALK